MSYEAALNDVDDEDFPDDTKTEVVVKCIGKRKVIDNYEESDDESPKKGFKFRKSNQNMWSKQKTDKLLELVRFNKDRLVDKRIKKLSIWKDIWEELQIIDQNVTLEQVERKWRNILQIYRKFNENLKTGANPRMKKPDYFEIVDEVVRTESYSNFELSSSESISVSDVRGLKDEADIDLSSCLECNLNSEEDLAEVPKSNTNMWPKEKTDKLLELVKFNKEKLLLDKHSKKVPVWKDIWEELRIIDHNVTLEQVERKWRNLLHSYRKFIGNLKTGANFRKKKPDYFESVDEIVRSEHLELDSSDNIAISDVRSLGEVTVVDMSKLLECRMDSEQDSSEDDLPESPDSPEISREGKRPRRKRPSSDFGSVKKSIRQLVETSESAIRIDRIRLKFLEAQTSRQDKFDKEVLEAITERNIAIQKSSNVINEFKEMLKEHLELVKDIDARTNNKLKEHMKLVKDIDARTKKMEKLMDIRFKTNDK